LLWVMKDGRGDFTLVFRRLSQALRGDAGPVQDLLEQSGAFDIWAKRWRKRLEREGAEADARADAMDRVNPVYIPRNHKVEEALAAAVNRADMNPFSRLLAVLSRPFDEAAGDEAYTEPAPATGTPYKTFCGT
jgi:uncharacterized protein YdiU (UPF0061 family)